MPQRQSTIKGFILTAAFAVSLLIFIGIYLPTSKIFERSARNNAEAVSRTLAEGTFNAMFQIMRQGWKRPQLEEFIASLNTATDGSDHTIRIFRGDKVTRLFGPIAEDPADAAVQQAFRLGATYTEHSNQSMRYIYPLAARNECLRCHTNAAVGDVLGVIDVRQNLGPQIDRASDELFTTLMWLAPIPFLVALVVALFLNRKINVSLGRLEEGVARIHHVSDLSDLDLQGGDLGFAELNRLFTQLKDLSGKLRAIAIDKELLGLEVALLEKCVITSDVVRNWREYVSSLLGEINQITEVCALFGLFHRADGMFDLEVFWLRRPTTTTRLALERAVADRLASHPAGAGIQLIGINHTARDNELGELALAEHHVDTQVQLQLADGPKIGGINGIGLLVESAADESRSLVLESILSTLLNVIGSVRAIHKYTGELEYYATRDPLTHLYNQRIFWEMLSYETKRASRHNYHFALFVIDFDNFKSINDSYGHAFGDQFLNRFANTIGAELRSGDVFARYGGDEFVVILPETAGEEAEQIAQRILLSASSLAIEAPDGSRITATVSLGIAMYPEHATEAKDLFLFADNMMYKAKSHGKNRIGRPNEEDVVATFRSIGEKNLLVSKAINEGRVVPYFQPIAHSGGSGIAAYEVLSRIPLDGDQILGANEFIEVAERSGLIDKMDYLVMDRAIATAKEANYHGLLFINVSPRVLEIGEYLHDIKNLTTKHNFNPANIVFEFTERDTVQNLAALEQFVHQLKADGFKFAIDDFGSGFSSFGYLKRFPIDVVKIEGDFVANMRNDPRDRAVVNSIAALTRELGIMTVAEHVEDEETLALIRDAGITFAQGYYIGRPNPALEQVA